MLNILTDPVITLQTDHGDTAKTTLPGVYAALMRDEVVAFPNLRPHQTHPWHAFLVQLGAIAVQQGNLPEPPQAASQWLKLLRNLTPKHPGGEPWQLVVDDPRLPAFMQPPTLTPERSADYKTTADTPDQIDALGTVKNHDVKNLSPNRAETEDWLYALISLQTTAGYGGAGNYGVSRMNGAFGSRQAFFLAPSHRPGPSTKRDIAKLLATGKPLAAPGHALLWTLPWNGGKAEALSPDALAPLYIEVCRRVRIHADDNGRLYVKRATSKAARVDAKGRNGVTGDPWALIDKRDRNGVERAYTPRQGGYPYRRIAAMLDPAAFRLPLLAEPDPAEADAAQPMTLVIRGIAMTPGKPKSAGCYERLIPLQSHTVRLLSATDGPQRISDLAQDRIADINALKDILGHAIALYAAQGESNAISRTKRDQTRPWTNRLDDSVDPDFFDRLQEELTTEEPNDQQAVRAAWRAELASQARDIMEQAVASPACPQRTRYQAAANARALFHSRLRRDQRLGNPKLQEPPEPQPAPAPPKPKHPVDWGNHAMHFCGVLSYYPAHNRGGLATLRRMNPEDQQQRPEAYWRLLASRNLLDSDDPDPVAELKWAFILHGIAVMTGNSLDDLRGNSAHAATSLGQALYTGGAAGPVSRPFYSPSRLNCLLNSRGESLLQTLGHVFRMAAANGVAFNWWETAQLIKHADGGDPVAENDAFIRVARDYRQAGQRNSQPKSNP